jgi:hypothetical protein
MPLMVGKQLVTLRSAPGVVWSISGANPIIAIFKTP